MPSIAGPGAIAFGMMLTNRMPWCMMVILVTVAVLVCTLFYALLFNTYLTAYLVG